MERTVVGLVLAKIETAYGTDAIPVGAANVIAVTKNSVKWDPKYTHVARQVLDGSIGPVQGLNAMPVDGFSFKTEVRGNRTNGVTADISAGGSAATIEIDPLLQACDLAPAYTAESPPGARNGNVVYSPTVPADQGKSVTFYFYTGLKLHRVVGCKGTFKVNFTAGKMGEIDWTFTGKYAGAVDSPLPAAGSSVQLVAVGAAGSGYAVGDVLTIAGGTLAAGGSAATARVTCVDGNGAILGIYVQQAGLYSAAPVTAANAATGGTGTGATLNLTLWTQSAPVWLNTLPPLFQNSGSTIDSFSPVFTKLDFDLGLKVEKREDGNSVDGIAGFVVTDRKPKVTIDPESVAEGTSPIFGDLYNSQKRTITGNIGALSGNQCQLKLVAMSEAVTYGDRSGIRTGQISYSVERQNLGDIPGSEIRLKFY